MERTTQAQVSPFDSQERALQPVQKSKAPTATRQDTHNTAELSPYFNPLDIALNKALSMDLVSVDNGKIFPTNKNLPVLPCLQPSQSKAIKEWLTTPITYCKTISGCGQVKIRTSLQEIISSLEADAYLIGSGVLWWLGTEYFEKMLVEMGASEKQLRELMTSEVRQWFKHLPNDFDIRIWLPGATQNELETSIKNLELALAEKLPPRFKNIKLNDQDVQNHLKKTKGYVPVEGRSEATMRLLVRQICLSKNWCPDVVKNGTLFYFSQFKAPILPKSSCAPSRPIDLTLCSKLALDSIEEDRWTLKLDGSGHIVSTATNPMETWAYGLNWLFRNFVPRNLATTPHDQELFLRNLLNVVKGGRSLQHVSAQAAEIAWHIFKNRQEGALDRGLSLCAHKHYNKGISGKLALLINACLLGRQSIPQKTLDALWNKNTYLFTPPKNKLSRETEALTPSGHPILAAIQSALIHHNLPAQEVLDLLSILALSALVCRSEGVLDKKSCVKLIDHEGKWQLQLSLDTGGQKYHLLLPICPEKLYLSLGQLCTSSQGHEVIKELTQAFMPKGSLTQAAPAGLTELLKENTPLSGQLPQLTHSVFALQANESPEIQRLGFLLAAFVHALQPLSDSRLTRQSLRCFPQILEGVEEEELLSLVHFNEMILAHSHYKHLLTSTESSQPILTEQRLSCTRGKNAHTNLYQNHITALAGSPEQELRDLAIELWSSNPSGPVLMAKLIDAFLSSRDITLTVSMLENLHRNAKHNPLVWTNKLLQLHQLLKTEEYQNLKSPYLRTLEKQILENVQSCRLSLNDEQVSLVISLIEDVLSLEMLETTEKLLQSLSTTIHRIDSAAYLRIHLKILLRKTEKTPFAEILKDYLNLAETTKDLIEQQGSDTASALYRYLVSGLQKEASAMTSHEIIDAMTLIHSLKTPETNLQKEWYAILDTLVSALINDKQAGVAHHHINKWKSLIASKDLRLLQEKVFRTYLSKEELGASRRLLLEILDGTNDKNGLTLLKETFAVMLKKGELEQALKLLRKQKIGSLLSHHKEERYRIVQSCLTASQNSSLPVLRKSQLLHQALISLKGVKDIHLKDLTIISQHFLALAQSPDFQKDAQEKRAFQQETTPYLSSLFQLVKEKDTPELTLSFLQACLLSGHLPKTWETGEIIKIFEAQLNNSKTLGIKELHTLWNKLIHLRPKILTAHSSAYQEILHLIALGHHRNEDPHATLQALNALADQKSASRLQKSCFEISLKCAKQLVDEEEPLKALEALFIYSADDEEKILKFKDVVHHLITSLCAPQRCIQGLSVIKALSDNLDSSQHSDLTEDVALLIHSVLKENSRSAVVQEVIELVKKFPELPLTCWKEIVVALVAFKTNMEMHQSLCDLILQSIRSKDHADPLIDLAIALMNSSQGALGQYSLTLLNTLETSRYKDLISNQKRQEWVATLFQSCARHLGSFPEEKIRSQTYTALMTLSGIYRQGMQEASPRFKQIYTLSLITSCLCAGPKDHLEDALKNLNSTLPDWISELDSSDLPFLVQTLTNMLLRLKAQERKNLKPLLKETFENITRLDLKPSILTSCCKGFVEKSIPCPEALEGCCELLPQAIEKATSHEKTDLLLIAQTLCKGENSVQLSTLLKALELPRARTLFGEQWIQIMDRLLEKSLQVSQKNQEVQLASRLVMKSIELLKSGAVKDVESFSCLNEVLFTFPWLADSCKTSFIYNDYIQPFFAALPDEYFKNLTHESRGQNGRNLSPLLKLMTHTINHICKSSSTKTAMRSLLIGWLNTLNAQKIVFSNQEKDSLRYILKNLFQELRFFPTPNLEAKDFQTAHDLLENWKANLFSNNSRDLLKLQYLAGYPPPKVNTGTKSDHREGLENLIQKAKKTPTPWGITVCTSLAEARGVALYQGNPKSWMKMFSSLVETHMARPHYHTQGIYIGQRLCHVLEEAMPAWRKDKSIGKTKCQKLIKKYFQQLLNAVKDAAIPYLTESADLSSQSRKAILLSLIVTGNYIVSRAVHTKVFEKDFRELFHHIEALIPLNVAYLKDFKQLHDDGLLFFGLDQICSAHNSSISNQKKSSEIVTKWIHAIHASQGAVSPWHIFLFSKAGKKKGYLSEEQCSSLQALDRVDSGSRKHIENLVKEEVDKGLATLPGIMIPTFGVNALKSVLNIVRHLYLCINTAIDFGIYKEHPTQVIELLSLLSTLAGQVIPAEKESRNLTKFMLFLQKIESKCTMTEESLKQLGEALHKFCDLVNAADEDGEYTSALLGLLTQGEGRKWFPDTKSLLELRARIEAKKGREKALDQSLSS